MCGRYELDNIEGIAERYDVDTDDIELQPNHNVRPTQIMPVVVFDDQAKRNKLKLMRWGIRPHWAKKDLINAQSEKISTSSVWKKMHHGIVVAKRFYEWDQETHLPIAFGVEGQPLISLAGLYTVERLEDGTEQERYVIVTTTPNETVARVHNRMPLILPPDMEELYISEGNKEGLLYAIAKPYSDSLMTAEEVAPL